VAGVTGYGGCMRWIAPLLFVIAAAFVWRHNAESLGSSILYVPGIALFDAEADLVEKGDLSVRLLAAVGGALLVWEIWRSVRTREWFED
jgi:hypothetical protein